MNIEDIKIWLSDCERVLEMSNCPFNKWERDFLESLVEQLNNKNRISDKQAEKLKDVWDKI